MTASPIILGDWQSRVPDNKSSIFWDNRSLKVAVQGPALWPTLIHTYIFWNIMLGSLLKVNWLHGIKSQKTDLFITITVTTSNPISVNKFITIHSHLMIAQKFVYHYIINIKKKGYLWCCR
jgi:hypothetical protein